MQTPKSFNKSTGKLVTLAEVRNYRETCLSDPSVNTFTSDKDSVCFAYGNKNLYVCRDSDLYSSKLRDGKDYIFCKSCIMDGGTLTNSSIKEIINSLDSHDELTCSRCSEKCFKSRILKYKNVYSSSVSEEDMEIFLFHLCQPVDYESIRKIKEKEYDERQRKFDQNVY